MKNLSTNKQGKQVSYGRPRLLTHDEILGGAAELGLEGLTMKRLATHLNVGVATLYQYFDSRKALMRAAAVHSLSSVPLPEDTGQHWSALAREYTKALQSFLGENPSFIQSYSHTDYGFEVRFKLTERFLESMTARGFSPQEGMELFNIIGMAAYGGAVETTRQREFEFDDDRMTDAAKRQFARLDPSDFPNTKDALSVFTQTPEEKIEALLSAAFRSIARDRGESEGEVL